MIFVDADSCVKQAKNFIENLAIKKNIKTVFVANRNIPLSTKNQLLIKTYTCEKTKDAADNFIKENAKEGDIAITRDLLLASFLLKKEISVINDRGTIFTEKNIDSFLEERKESLMYKSLGISPGGKKIKSYGSEDLKRFKENLFNLTEKLETSN